MVLMTSLLECDVEEEPLTRTRHPSPTDQKKPHSPQQEEEVVEQVS